ncbi:tyrosine-type recombinase/integrase [Pandoraea communis]|uniref:tyrosine-type recombinase/integrase n=1 Tax=Pandoraea communis TaxID=2508297 RepID=UPI0025A60E8F|nr:tyrosine-type recombinase/integrase [Pandoraea communis]MDM8357521.1 tyrosine-type recombinase/integrase [Pandoraea communis]
MGRKPSKNLNLPVGMRARPRGLKVFYYLDRGGRPRVEIPLGSDYVLAIAEYSRLMQDVKVAKGGTFDDMAKRYEEEVIPTKKPGTQRDNTRELEPLRYFFSKALLSEIKPLHIRQYMDWRPQWGQVKTKIENEARAKAGEPPLKMPALGGNVRANREKALFSHMWNKAREWGYTDLPNPCAGVKGYRETGRNVYIDDDMYTRVYKAASQPLRDAMDLAYLTGQRPSDALKLADTDIKEGALWLRQDKTGTPLRISIEGELKEVIDRINAGKTANKVRAFALVCDESGKPLGARALRTMFDDARAEAGIEKSAFQFRDLRAKAATEKDMTDGIGAARDQLGHSSEAMTRKYVRHRAGKLVKPTR